MKDKKEEIKKVLLEKYGIKEIQIKRSGTLYHITIWDIIPFELVDKIDQCLIEVIGYNEKYNWIRSFSLHCSNTRFKEYFVSAKV